MPARPQLSAIRTYLTLQGVASFCFALMFTTNMIYQATVIGLTPLQLVLVGTTLEITCFLFEIPTGIVADTYSRRLSLLIGYALIGIGFIIEAALPTFAVVLLTQVIWGIGATFTSGAEQAWITDEIGTEAAGRAFLRGSQVGAVGGLIGIIVAGVLGSVLVNLPIFIGGVLMCAMVGYLALRMPETGFKPTPREDRNTWQQMTHTLRGGLALIRLRPMLYMVIAAGLLYGLFSEGYDRLNVQHILTNFTFPALPIVGTLSTVAWISLLSAGSAILGLFVTEGLIRRLDTGDRQAIARALFWTSVPMIGALALFGFTESVVIMIFAYWLFNTTRGVTGALYNTWSNHYFEPETRATMNSLMSQMNAIGQIVGGPPVGGFAEFMTPRAGLGVALRLTMGLCSLILAPILYFYARAMRSGNQTESKRIKQVDAII